MSRQAVIKVLTDQSASDSEPAIILTESNEHSEPLLSPKHERRCHLLAVGKPQGKGESARRREGKQNKGEEKGEREAQPGKGGEGKEKGWRCKYRKQQGEKNQRQGRAAEA